MYFNFILRNTRRSRFLPFCSTCPPSNRHIRWTGVQHTPVTLGLKSDQWWSWTEVHKININTGMSVFKRAVGQLPQCRLQGTVVTLLSFSFWIFCFRFSFHWQKSHCYQSTYHWHHSCRRNSFATGAICRIFMKCQFGKNNLFTWAAGLEAITSTLVMCTNKYTVKKVF